MSVSMKLPLCHCQCIDRLYVPIMLIMEYGSTPYVGMATKKNGVPIKCVQNDMFITLV